MKNVIIFILIIAISLFSCKKDYPKDIPDWLKTKIKELKKEDCGDLPLTIIEYENYSTGELIYNFSKQCPMCKSGYYDCNGNIMCYENYDGLCCTDINTSVLIIDTCLNMPINNFQRTRIIWTQSCD